MTLSAVIRPTFPTSFRSTYKPTLLGLSDLYQLHGRWKESLSYSVPKASAARQWWTPSAPQSQTSSLLQVCLRGLHSLVSWANTYCTERLQPPSEPYTYNSTKRTLQASASSTIGLPLLASSEVWNITEERVTLKHVRQITFSRTAGGCNAFFLSMTTLLIAAVLIILIAVKQSLYSRQWAPVKHRTFSYGPKSTSKRTMDRA